MIFGFSVKELEATAQSIGNAYTGLELAAAFG